MKNKRGSHVDFMLSFSMFIIFLVFAYTLIGQEEIFSNTKEDAISNLETNFMERIMTNVTIVSVFENDSDYDCVIVDVGDFGNYSSYIVRANDQSVESYKTGDNLKMVYDGGATLFKIYFSENNISHTSVTNTDCVTSDIESVQIRKAIFEERILSAKEDYQDYSELKNSLKVPIEKEFGFEFEYENGTIIKTREKEIFGEVYVREILIDYFSKEGIYSNGKLRLKIW